MQTPFEKRENNLDCIRLLLAILVIFSHSFPLGVGSVTPDPLSALTHWETSLGSMAVDLFFIISGFLITASYERSPGIGSYLGKRVRRIYPAFLLVSLVDLLVVLRVSGGHLTFRTRASQLIDFVSQTLRLREFHYTAAFATNPTPGGINGSSWSLQWEFWCYILVILLGVSGILRSRRTLVVLFGLAILVSLRAELMHWGPGDARFEWVFGDVFIWVRVLPMYLAGAVFYRFRAHLSLQPLWIAGAFGLLLAAIFVPHGWRAFFPVAGAYLVLALAYHPAIRLHGWSRYGDFSYGTYLYAFQVQQVLMLRIGHPIAAWKLFALATPVSLVCAVGSWYGVERWFLRPARKVDRSAPAAAEGAVGESQVQPPARWSHMGPIGGVPVRGWAGAVVRVVRRWPMRFAAFALLAIKILEFALDSQALFVDASTAYLRNALGLHVSRHTPHLAISFLWPTYSFVYSWMLRVLVVPVNTVRAIVALQMAMGALSAWLLLFSLVRFFRVRLGVAFGVAVLFAMDPVQVVYEHLVLTETVAMLAMAVYLLLALRYLEVPTWRLAVGLAVLAALLTSLNVMYVPVVYGAALLLPLLASVGRGGRWGSLRGLAVGVVLSVGATGLMQWGLRHVTGRVAGGPAAYDYETGFLLLADVSPMVVPKDASDARMASVIEAQQRSAVPLLRSTRSEQATTQDGLIAGIRRAFGTNAMAADRAAWQIAWHAIRRNKKGFVRLGVETYWDYWDTLPRLTAMLAFEDGLAGAPAGDPALRTIAEGFRGYNLGQVAGRRTWSRRVHLAAGAWNIFLLLVWPVVAGLGLWLRPVNLRGVWFLFVWSGLLLGAACLMGEPSYRYLHPLSLSGLAVVGVAWSDGLARSARTRGTLKSVSGRGSRAQTVSVGV